MTSYSLAQILTTRDMDEKLGRDLFNSKNPV
jgi:hypothetical protein